MMDYPEPAATELHQTIQSPRSLDLRGVFNLFDREQGEPTIDPLYQAAQSIVNSLGEGFSLHSIYELVFKSYEFVKTQQGLSLEDQKSTLTTLINHIIDITDTPYLPDTLTDPIFKALTPSLLDLFLSFQGPNAQLIPQINLEPPSPQTFQLFLETLQETYADGFQLSDIAVYIQKTSIFVMGFSNLTDEEKLNSTCDIVNMIIDNINFGPLPSAITSPILKSFTKPLIQTIFSKI